MTKKYIVIAIFWTLSMVLGWIKCDPLVTGKWISFILGAFGVSFVVMVILIHYSELNSKGDDEAAGEDVK